MHPLNLQGKVISKKSNTLQNNIPGNIAGTRFEGVSNPYVSMPREQTFWDKVSNWFGFRSGYDKAVEQYQLASDEYNAQLSQLASEEQYNSPIEQAQRMREAGLNPDLTGVSGEPASEFDNQQQSPDVAGVSGDIQNTLSSFANGVMNIFTSSLGLASSIQGVMRNKIENNILRLNESKGISDFASSIFPYLIPETAQIDEAGTTPTGSFLELANIFSGGLPKNVKNQFLRTVNAFWHSAPGSKETYDAWKERISAKKGYTLESNTFYDPDTDEVLDVITTELSHLNEEVIKSSFEARKASNSASVAESQNNEAYYNSLDSSLQGETENAVNEFNKVNMDMNKILNESLGRMIDKLEENRKEKGIGGGLSSIALALLASFRLMITTQGLPTLSRSSSSGTSWNGNTGVITGERSSSSTSFGW